MCLIFPVLVTITALSHFTSSITGQYIPAVRGLLVFYSAGYIFKGSYQVTAVMTMRNWKILP